MSLGTTRNPAPPPEFADAHLRSLLNTPKSCQESQVEMQAAIRAVTEHRNLTSDEMSTVMHTIMSGKATPAQIGAFLVGLRMKGETVTEIAAAARVMRQLSTKVVVSKDHLVDTCGTGGDGVGTFNISTTAAFVAAAAGARVAKHGNRAVSSRCGSADVLEAAGVKLDLTPEQTASCINNIGLGFMFAPLHHSAMKYAIGPRRELGMRTIFNLLGPLTNPAGAPNHVLGVFSKEWVEAFALVLKDLGNKHVMVVYAADGMDELSISAPTSVAELVNNTIETYDITPEQFGLTRASADVLTVDSVDASLAVMRAVLDNKLGPPQDIVTLNAGAAIYTSGLAEDLKGAIETAQSVIATGAARKKLNSLIEFTNSI